MDNLSLRITLDCWHLGCGWSRVGYNFDVLHDQWVDHNKEKHVVREETE